MSILGKLAQKSMKANRTRTVVTVIAVVLATAMFTAVATLAFSIQNYLIRDAVYRIGDYYDLFYYCTDKEKEIILKNDKISSVADYQALGFLMLEEKPSHWSSFVLAAGDEAFFETMPVHLVEGRLPENSGEILLPDGGLEALNFFGVQTQVGSQITLNITTNYDDSNCEDGVYQSAIRGIEPPIPERSFQTVYTVVGIYRGHSFEPCENSAISPGLAALLTFSDGDQPSHIWHWLYVKTHQARDARDLGRELRVSQGFSTNDALLSLYGSVRHDETRMTAAAACASLVIIILISSVSVIYNAFAISVSQRTKQFGLLGSVGATRKQIRRSVLFEASGICLLGIPAGLLLGYGSIAAAGIPLQSHMANLFAGTAPGVRFRAVPSPGGFLCGAVLPAATVFLSAWLPARRAAKVTPIEAVRHSDAYTVSQKTAKSRPWGWKIGGFPWAMARKYGCVGRKKYRAIVISLAVSVALFLTAAGFSENLLRTASDVPTQSFDFRIDGAPEQLEAIRNLPYVSQSAYQRYAGVIYSVRPEDWNPEYQEAVAFWESKMDAPMWSEYVSLYFLEDGVLKEYLEKNHIEVKPYLNRETPAALVCPQRVVTSYYQNEAGEWEDFEFTGYALCPEAEKITLYHPMVYDAAAEYAQDALGLSFYELKFLQTPEGLALYRIVPILETEDEEQGTIRQERDEANAVYLRLVSEGDTVLLYPYDLSSGETDSPAVASVENRLPDISLGQRIETLPYGIEREAGESQSISLILPLSVCPWDSASLAVSVTDYRAMIAYLDGLPTDAVQYDDYFQKEAGNRSLAVLISAFSRGFLALISLICAAGVFHTVSTGVTLRRQDFGTLLCLGMKKKELQRMVDFECVQYGLRAFLWGVPIGLAADIGISLAMQSTFHIPWTALAVSAMTVLFIVFAGMAYSLSKLRKENPIEAIRMENI